MQEKGEDEEVRGFRPGETSLASVNDGGELEARRAPNYKDKAVARDELGEVAGERRVIAQ
jgi:hypothetical protein